MIGYLYRYPHPYDPTKFIYVGQGIKRDRDHRVGKTSFGRRFRRDFPEIELPQPIREQVKIRDRVELNELETIWMFQFHTWRGYSGGMNLTLPGSTDYENLGRITGFITAKNKTGIFSRTPEQVSKDSRKGGCIGGRVASESGQLEIARNLPQAKVAQRLGGRIGGFVGGRISPTRHVRWHVKRNKINLKCKFCREG